MTLLPPQYNVSVYHCETNVKFFIKNRYVRAFAGDYRSLLRITHNLSGIV